MSMPSQLTATPFGKPCLSLSLLANERASYSLLNIRGNQQCKRGVTPLDMWSLDSGLHYLWRACYERPFLESVMAFPFVEGADHHIFAKNVRRSVAQGLDGACKIF